MEEAVNNAAQAYTNTAVDFVIITDPGPDPDDTKALLIASIAHKQGQIRLKGVVCNGGQQPHARAKLARCILDHIGLLDVPIGVGSDGQTYEAMAHEFHLEGFDSIDEGRLETGPGLLQRCLQAAATKGLIVVCISCLRDFSDLLRESPLLVLEKVQTVAIMGGLENFLPGEELTCKPDSTVNNLWDIEAAELVYRFCFQHGLQMTVSQGKAIPSIPMSLAADFAHRFPCPIMRYLHHAQVLGLVGLWKRLCEGDLPARCTKQWYFESFCAIDARRFEVENYDKLDGSVDIRTFLNGTVKPYDVIALMTVLPSTKSLFPKAAEHDFLGVRHLLLLEPEYTISSQRVVELLRSTYQEVTECATSKERLCTE
mmetsp:Transcript_81698/g.239846  ORF Transcript_81698/g.239846 Transcript_81698/m.239846 type:complete len:370 (+) Transcript_81698:111-1220(+)